MKKIKLEELEITTFGTALSESAMKQVKGGDGEKEDNSHHSCTPKSFMNCPTAGYCSTSDLYGTFCMTTGTGA